MTIGWTIGVFFGSILRYVFIMSKEDPLNLLASGSSSELKDFRILTLIWTEDREVNNRQLRSIWTRKSRRTR